MYGSRGLAEVADGWVFVRDLITAGQPSKLKRLQSLGGYRASDLMWKFSRTEECRNAIHSELETKQVNCNDASSYIFRSSLFEILDEHESARDILETSPFQGEGTFAYSSERYRREIDCKRKQREFVQRPAKRRKSEPFPRIDLKDFNENVYYHHVQSKTPFIIYNANVSSESFSDSWLMRHLGHLSHDMYRPLEGSIHWASLELSENRRLSWFFENWMRDDFDFQIYELSLPNKCPELLQFFQIPEPFKPENNWLNKTPTGMEFSDIFPGLFIQNTNSRSGLHVDQLFMPYWTALLRGKKMWRIYHPEDFWMLNPTWVGGNIHPSFDVSKSSLAHFARRWEGELNRDEILWGPGGSPHEVFNCGETVSLNGNLMDKFHFDDFLEDVKTIALVDTDTAKFKDEMLKVQQKSR